MKFFISLPMNGVDDEKVKRDIDIATKLIREQFEGSEVIDGFIAEDVPADAGRLWYLGRSIQMLGTADAVVFMPGWKKANGCLIVYEVARLYGITRLRAEKEGGVWTLKRF